MNCNSNNFSLIVSIDAYDQSSLKLPLEEEEKKMISPQSLSSLWKSSCLSVPLRGGTVKWSEKINRGREGLSRDVKIEFRVAKADAASISIVDRLYESPKHLILTTFEGHMLFVYSTDGYSFSYVDAGSHLSCCFDIHCKAGVQRIDE